MIKVAIVRTYDPDWCNGDVDTIETHEVNTTQDLKPILDKTNILKDKWEDDVTYHLEILEVTL